MDGGLDADADEKDGKAIGLSALSELRQRAEENLFSEVAVTPTDLDRFRKICGLLASGHDGERAAAAKKASEFLAMKGLSWSDVVLPVKAVPGAIGADLEQAVRRANPSRADRAAKRAAWKERSYGADADGFEPGRK
jgi:hypothetical protein